MGKLIQCFTILLIILLPSSTAIIADHGNLNADCSTSGDGIFVEEERQFYLSLQDHDRNELDHTPINLTLPDAPCEVIMPRFWLSSVIHQNNLVLFYEYLQDPYPSTGTRNNNHYRITEDNKLHAIQYETIPELEDMRIFVDNSGYRLYKNSSHLAVYTIDGDLTMINYGENMDNLIGSIPHTGVLSQDGRYLYLLNTMVYRTPIANGSIIFDDVTKLVRTELSSLTTVTFNLTRDNMFKPTEDMFEDFGDVPDIELVSPYSNNSIYVVEEIETSTVERASYVYKVDMVANTTVMSERLEVDTSQIYDLDDKDILVSKEKGWYRLDKDLSLANSAPIITMDSDYFLQIIYEIDKNPRTTSIIQYSIVCLIVLGLLTRSIISSRKPENPSNNKTV